MIYETFNIRIYIYLPVEIFVANTNNNKIRNSKTKLNKDLLLFMFSLEIYFNMIFFCFQLMIMKATFLINLINYNLKVLLNLKN